MPDNDLFRSQGSIFRRIYFHSVRPSAKRTRRSEKLLEQKRALVWYTVRVFRRHLRSGVAG